MNRKEIMVRVNQRLDGRMYRWDEVKYDFDDAILEINNKLQADFPMFTEIMLYPENEYKYYFIIDPSLGVIRFNSLEEFNESSYAPSYPNEEDISNEKVFPDKYIRTVVIPFVVARLLQREDEFGNLQSAIHQESVNGLQNMYFEYYDKIPKYFIEEGGVLINTSKHNTHNPFEIKGVKYRGVLDPLDQGDE